MRIKNLATIGLASLVLGAMPSANAFDTLVQFSSDGTGDGINDGAAGGYDIVGINEFDWQSTGDLVIHDNLTGSGSTADGVLVDSFTAWAGTAVVGDTVTFDADVQARLNDMLDATVPEAGSVAPATLSRNGSTCDAGANCFEITAATSFVESATLVAPNLLQFNSISGTFTAFYDSSPDSAVIGGTGFTDGDVLMSGSMTCTTSGACGTFTQGVGGSTFVTVDIGIYDNSYIEVDPISALTFLSGATFDTLVSLVSTDEPNVGVGGTIGLAPYTVLLSDLILKADANSEFEATERRVPEPSTIALLGVGLLGMAGLRRRKQR